MLGYEKEMKALLTFSQADKGQSEPGVGTKSVLTFNLILFLFAYFLRQEFSVYPWLSKNSVD